MKNLRTVLTSVLTGALLCVAIIRMNAEPVTYKQPATSFPPVTDQKHSSSITQVADDIEVVDLQVEAGIHGKLWSTDNAVRTTIRNNGNLSKSNILVTLNITGANTFTTTLEIPSLPAGASEELIFQTTAVNVGNQQISVSVVNDDLNSNNQKTIAQQIDCSSYRFGLSENIFGQVGSGAAAGILAVKYPVPDVPLRIDAVTVKLTSSGTSVGKSVYAVILDEAGEIVTNSNPIIITTEMLGTEQMIVFESPVTFLPGEKFMAGIAQEEGGHDPVASSLPAQAASDRMFLFPLTGSAETEINNSGQWLIGIKTSVVAEIASTAIGQIMEGTQVWFIGSEGFDNYNFKANGISKYSGPDNFTFFYPANGDDITLELTKNGCTYTVPDHIILDVLPITPSAEKILYVNKHNPNPGDGSSWTNSIAELSDALRWAKVRESNFTATNPLKIFVASGTYKPLYSAVDETFGMEGGPNNAFLLPKHVQLYGGFQGNEVSPADRNLSADFTRTVLSGDYSDDDEFAGSGNTLTLSNTQENAIHVVIASGETGTSLLDGFVIKGGGGNMTGVPFELVNGNQISVNTGGAIYLHGSSPQLNNLLIFANRAAAYGGGIYTNNSSSVITNILLLKNIAGNSGGAIFNENNSSVVLTNLTITGNRSLTSGGGIANAGASLKIRNTILYGNSSGITNTNSNTQIAYSLIQGIGADPVNHNPDGATDPLFANPLTNNFTLKSNSPAVNGGNNLYFQPGQLPDLTSITKDLTGKVRIQENTIDLGAYESSPTLILLQHPQSINSCMDTDASMNVVVSSSGANPPVFQWQQSTDAQSWSNINGANQQSYLFKTTGHMYFRCIISIPGYSIQSDAALLTAIPVVKPVISVAEKICLDEKIISLNATPAGGWFDGQGVVAGNWNLNGLKPGKQTIRYVLLDENGCEAEAIKTVQLLNCAEGELVKSYSGYPNPTRGMVKVKLMIGEAVEAQLQVTSGDGLPVLRKMVNLTRGLNQLEIDLGPFANGLYFISIFKEPKKPLVMLRILKQ